MSVVAEKATECAACGGPIVHPVGINGDFCKIKCFRTGRSFCKQCREPLIQEEGKWPKKEFCDNNLCQARYRTVRGHVNPLYWEERFRKTCLMCTDPITQPRQGGRKFCDKPLCRSRYHNQERLRSRPSDTLQEWGSYESGVRKVLQDLKKLGLIGEANRLADAITCEYIPRSHIHRNMGKGITTYICETCGKEFKRRSDSQRSTKYCNNLKCHPSQSLGPHNAKLTWEEVDEIRRLHESGVMSIQALADKYGVARDTISAIVHYESYKPEYDPRKRDPKSQEWRATKFTWDDIDEIRRLRKSGLSAKEIAEKYGVWANTIRKIVSGSTWKPENDPRRKAMQS